MKAKTRVRIIFFCLTVSAIGLPLILISTPSIHQHFEPENIATHFNISYSEMNTSQDTLFVQGKLFFSHKHKLIRKINLTLVNRRGSWLVDCRDNTIF